MMVGVLKKRVALCLGLAAFLCLPLNTFAAEKAVNYETIGILNDASEGQLAPNVWQGLSHQNAVDLVRALPNTYGDAASFELARRLLLSDAPAFKTKGKDESDLLAARLDKLIAMGALRDAEQLYTTATNEQPQSMDIAFKGMTILMLRNQLPAVCLDVQTFADKFGSDPLWQDMDAFCTAALPNVDQAPVEVEMAETQAQAPAKLQPKTITLTKFKVLTELQGLSPSSKFENLSPTSLAFAVALGYLPATALETYGPKAVNLPTLFLAVLRETGALESNPPLGCVLTSLAARGALDVVTMRGMFEKARFEGAWLQPKASRGVVPPCLQAPLAYQLAALHMADETKAAEALAESVAMLKGRALAVRGVLAKPIAESAKPVAAPQVFDAARISAAYGNEWPESSFALNPEAALPFEWMVKGTAKPTESFAAWAESHSPLAKQFVVEPTVYATLVKAVTEADKTPQKLMPYEKITSLTFSRNYGMTSRELYQSLAQAIEKQRTGEAIGIFLVAYGAAKPADIPPPVLAPVLKLVTKAGVTRVARRYAIAAAAPL